MKRFTYLLLLVLLFSTAAFCLITIPTLIQPGDTYTLYHSIDGNQGPFEWNGAAYAFGSREVLATGTFDRNTFYKTVDGATWSEVDGADAPTTGICECGYATIFYPKSGGSVIYALWNAPASLSTRQGTLNLSSFDMATDSWTVIATGGPTSTDRNEPAMLLVRLSDGTFVAQFDDPDGSSNRQSYYATYAGGMWSAATLISTGYADGTSARSALIGVTDSDVVLMLWYSIGGGGTGSVYANTLTAGVLSAKTTVYDLAAGGRVWPINSWDQFAGWNCYGVYLTSFDEVVWGVSFRSLAGDTAQPRVLIADTSVSPPTFSFTTVATSTGIGPISQNWSDFVTNDTQTQFTMAWNFSDNGFGATSEILIATATDPAGPWGSPTVFYNQVTDPPTPTPPTIDTNSLTARMLSGGLGLVVGMQSTQDGHEQFQTQYGLANVGAAARKIRHRASSN